MAEGQKTASETVSTEDFTRRVTEMRPKMEALMAEYQVTLGAKLNYLGDAIVPSPTFVDTKPAPEDVTPSASAMAAEEQKAA